MEPDSVRRTFWRSPGRPHVAPCSVRPSFPCPRQAAVADAPAQVLDPAVGAGALLIEVMLRLRAESPGANVEERVFGIDIDAAVVSLAAASLSFLAGTWRAGTPPSLHTNLVVADT